VREKIKLKIKRIEKTKKNEIKIWDICKLNKEKVKEFIKEVTADVQNTQLEEVEDINEMWNKIKRGISEATGKIIGK
jgi:cell division septum initiation protein DivIVA